ncbi:MAG: LysM peptidoglycan-binding domain-containing protein [Pseudomonadota bacterium]|nr:LysM peptidoglycan-binding domain-containing protein [Pseudomonadota bacterium]
MTGLLALMSGCATLEPGMGPVAVETEVDSPPPAQPPPPATRPAPVRQQAANSPSRPARSSTRVRAVAPDAPLVVQKVEAREVSIWPRIRDGFSLPATDHPRVDAQLRRMSLPAMEKVLARSAPYLYLIMEEIERRDMPMELALLPAIESGYDPFANSSSGAAGLWQFIPSTATAVGLRRSRGYDGRRDIPDSTTAALDYLEYLADRFDDDWLLALAAYNGGEGTVSRAQKQNAAAGRPTDYWHLPLRTETRNYVPKLLAMRRLVEQPHDYGIALPAITDSPVLAVVELDQPVDMRVAARLLECEPDEVRTNNAAHRRWMMDPQGPHRLLIPAERHEDFVAALAALPESAAPAWDRHVVRPGDTLSQLAVRHGTSIAAIKQLNGLRSNTLQVGQSLALPHAADIEEGTLYVVKPGETLFSIAKRHGVSATDLAAMNGLNPSTPLRTGQDLQIAGTARLQYQVRTGDTLSRIAHRFGVSVTDLRRWNNLNGDRLTPGQRLVLHTSDLGG